MPDRDVWVTYAKDLAVHLFELMVNRTDCYGGYYRRGEKTRQTTRHKQLDVAVLEQHFRAGSANDIVGLHTTNIADNSRWFCIDIDAHEGSGAAAGMNERLAVALWYTLSDLGLSPALFQSNGAGGFHLYVWFNQPVPTGDLWRFGKWLLQQSSTQDPPEFFPKQPTINGKFGNWVRLPGRHHTRDHYHRAWSGEGWLDAAGTANVLLSAEGDKPDVVLDPAHQVEKTIHPVLPAPSTNGERLPLAAATLELIENGAKVSERNDRLFAAACDMHGAGYTLEEIREQVTPAMVRSGLDTREINRTLRSACSTTRTPTSVASSDVLIPPWGVDVRTTRVSPARSVATAPWQPFPVSVLPDPLRSFVDEGAKAIGCDPVFVAFPAMASLASAIGTTRRIRLSPDWCEASILWLASVGDSGTKKSPPTDMALAPIHKHQKAAIREYRDSTESYELDCLEHDNELKEWKKKHTPGTSPPTKPRPQVRRRLICSDTTIEALAILLEENPRGLLVARDELSGWFGSFNEYKQGKGGDTAHWLELYRGGTLLIDRKMGRQCIYVPHAAVSICGTIQRKILRRCLGREHFDSGMAARFLMGMPPPRKLRWPDARLAERTKKAFADIITELLALEHTISEDDEPIPVSLPLTDEGQAAWIQFYNEHADLQEEAKATSDELGAVAAKLEAYCARFALIVHLVRVAAEDVTVMDAGAIDERSVDVGVQLTRWFYHEAKRIYSSLSETDAERKVRELYDYIRSRGGRVSVRNDLMRAGPCFKTVVSAKAALAQLEKAGLGRMESVKPAERTGPSSDIFILADETSADIAGDGDTEVIEWTG